MPDVNTGHVVATGGLAGALAIVFQHLSNWPLHSLDATSAAGYATLVVAAGAFIYGRYLQPKPKT